MILVDSSVLVAFLRGEGRRVVQVLDAALDDGIPICIEPYVFQEVLQGARDDREWRLLDEYLSSQRLVCLTNDLESRREAAKIYYDCRRRGWTIRSLVDCLVAQTALEHDLDLLAEDRDYDVIARVRPLRRWKKA